MSKSIDILIRSNNTNKLFLAVGSVLGYAVMMVKDLDSGPYPQVIAYMQRLKERPGYSMG